jgi:hypothetical protein
LSTTPTVDVDASLEVVALKIKVPLEVKYAALPDDTEIIDPSKDVVRPTSSVVVAAEWIVAELVVAIKESAIAGPPWGDLLGLHADDRRTSGLIWGVKGTKGEESSEERTSLLFKEETGREDAVE